MKDICVEIVNPISNRIKRKDWIRATGVRATRTFFQALSAGLIGVVTFSEVDWRFALSTALMASFISIINALGGIPEVNEQANG